MDENQIAKIIVDRAYHIHQKLGPGLLEVVYQKLLLYELGKNNLKCESEKPINVEYEGNNFGLGFRADIIVEGSVLIELKSVERIIPAHKKQILTYLKLTGIKLGLLINFNESLIKDGITRVVNNL